MVNDKKLGSPKAGFGWLLKMACRDGNASKQKLLLFIASIILGIAALVAIQSFSETLTKNIALQSKSLMGADFKIDSDAPPNEKVIAIMDSLGDADAREINFASMVAFTNNKTTKLVQIRGVEGDFPFYGVMDTDPKEAASTYQHEGGALVDATVMIQLGISVGDSIKVGTVKLPIAGALKSIPGSSAVFSAVAPPVVIPYQFISETGLVQQGSRIDYEFYFEDPDADLKMLDNVLASVLDKEHADLDTHTSTSERLGRRYENFGKFLNLVAFIALLLGCVGIASAMSIYVKEKLKSIAILKCLGATQRQTFLIYLIQIAIIGGIGGIIGTSLGLVLQQVFPIFLKDFLPIDIQLFFDAQIVVTGVILGILLSVLFALHPLMGTLYVSPLQALRIQENHNQKPKKYSIIISILIILFIFLFSFHLLKDWRYSLTFMGGMLITFSILGGIAKGLMASVKAYHPKSWGFSARHSLLNLFRPQNQTLILIVTIGVGTFLISTLYFSKDILLSQAVIDNKSNNANIILLDVQTDQKESLTNIINQQKLMVVDDIPIVTMRVHEINGRLANDIKRDSTSNINRWILNHEFRVTYRDSLIDSETLEEGKWVGKASKNSLTPISVSDNFAEDAKVDVGDQLTFDVQGVLIQTVVGSIRTVDWSRMQPNFTILFPAGVLEEAPQFRVITTNVPNETASAQLQQKLVQYAPNVTILDLRQVLKVIEDLLIKISLIINFMAFFSIITGVIVVLGAVRTSKYQRLKESVLLRTLGAKSSQIIKMISLEYLILGLLGSFSGILLALVATQSLAWFLFETPFVPSLIPFLVVCPLMTCMVVIIAIANSRSVIYSSPLEVLRKSNT